MLWTRRAPEDGQRGVSASESPCATSKAMAATRASSSQSSAAYGPSRDKDLTQREWWWLGWEQKLPVDPTQWARYEPNVSYHLCASLDAMTVEGRADGLVLDLAPFTDPPSPYQVWRARPVEVTNTNEPELCGKLAIAGYSKDLWDLPKEQLPPSAKHGKVVAGFYQVRRDHTKQLEEMNRYLTDSRNPYWPFTEPPRRRVVILIEIERPGFMFGDVDRFRKRRVPTVRPAIEEVEHDSVPPGEAVFQWWWGDPQEGGIGHWKNYHPHVSARLEKALSENRRFSNCMESVQIDEVRYNLQRISRDLPFDYVGQSSQGGFREPFLPSHIITVDFGLYDEQTRMTRNCFVQFQRGNPKRRRPVRRVRRGEAAGLEMPDGEPCGVCFSDTGVLTGCEKGHIICGGCLRNGLRIIVGDISQTENLLCGCLKTTDAVAFERLTHRADETLQALVAHPPEGMAERKEFAMELAQVRRAFQLAETIPKGIFKAKVEEWLEKVKQHAMEHLYYPCAQPGCGMANWILRTDFDRTYRVRSQSTWVCKQGHRNSVLPCQAEIDEMNRNILLHPEYYTSSCGHDAMSLRRFRLCPFCAAEGFLLFAMHEAGCKQWPGSTSQHRHCFCFHCTAKWGSRDGCNHGVQCSDPGIQQVRRMNDGRGAEMLQIGFIDGPAYVAWVRGARTCPPTVFPDGAQVRGDTRQGQLGMEDRTALRRTMEEGTR